MATKKAAPSFTLYTATIVGVRAMLHNNGRGANPRDPLCQKTKELRKIPQKNRSDDYQETLDRLEYKIGLYHHPEIGPYVPTDNLLKMLRDGAAARRQGKAIAAGVQFVDDEIAEGYPIQYEGPRDPDELYDYRSATNVPTFVDVRGARTAGKRIMKIRPIFPKGWRVTFKFLVATDCNLTRDDVEEAIRTAGSRVGICDYRPRYGLFQLESLEST